MNALVEILRWLVTVVIFVTLALVILKWINWEADQREQRHKMGFDD